MRDEGSLDKPGKERLVSEVLQYIMQSWKWRLLPTLLSFLVHGGLAFLNGPGAAPFVYMPL